MFAWHDSVRIPAPAPTAGPAILRAHKWIMLLLLADGGSPAVAWKHNRVIRQGVKLAANRAANLRRIAARQVRAPNAPLEKRIARDHSAFERKIERNAAGSVTRRVQDVRPDRSRANNIALPRGRVDPRIFGRFHAEPRGLHIESIAQHLVVLMHVYRSARKCPQLLRPADVIDMRVRDHDRFNSQAMAIEDFDDFGNLVSGIDHDRLAAGFVADHGAVASQHSNRQSLVNHPHSIMVTR